MRNILTISTIVLACTLYTTDIKGQCGSFNILQQVDVETLINSGCTELSGTLLIVGQDVQDLSGLQVLNSVGILSISQTGLASLDGLSGLSSAGEVDIRENASLSDISALSGLNEISSGKLVIRDCNALTSLDGLHNITTVASHVWVEHNQGLTDLSGLASLTSVGGTLWINDNDLLTDLTGLESLVSANRIGVVYHEQLQSFNGLQGITQVPQGLIIRENVSLTNLEGLQSLTHVGQELYVANNVNLADISSLANLTSIGGDPEVHAFYPDGFTMISNPALTSLHGLESLASIGATLSISYMNGLTSMEGLNALTSVGGLFRIQFNDNLESISDLASLNHIGGDVNITINPNLRACSIDALCEYLEASPEQVTIHSNNIGGCFNVNQVLANCSPVRDFFLIEANPGVLDEQFGVPDVRKLTAGQVLELTMQQRDALAADGVTEVVIVANLPAPGTVEMAHNSMPVEQPWGTNTVEMGGDHYGLALYTAPEQFNPDGSRSEATFQLQGVDSYSLPIEITYNDNKEIRVVTESFAVVRPPVVLVHGTFSSPEIWTVAADGHQSMTEVLEEDGFKVFAVDYTASNGNNDPSSFEHNKMVVWENPGGINEALTHFREERHTAVTQADVVGHSMGGLLPRVYTSEHYNPMGYARLDNYMEGDINRLITIASPHMGSHLGELRIDIADAQIPLSDLTNWLTNFAGHIILSYFTGSPATEAVRDQVPKPYGGEALDLIGPTPVPAHAIVASVPTFGLKDPVFDPEEEYYDLYWYTELMMYYNSTLREQYLAKKHALAEMGHAVTTTWDGSESSYYVREISDVIVFSDMIDQAIQSAGKLLSVLDGTYQPPTGAQLFKRVFNEVGMGDLVDIDPFIQLYQAYVNPVGVVTGYVVDQIMPSEADIRAEQESLHEKSIEGLRSLIFNNDANDGVVSMTSQRGMIDEGPDGCTDCVSFFDDVLHGFAPRYPDIQQAVVERLEGGMTTFHENGFPDPNETHPLFYPPNELDLYDNVVRGDKAICRSGMVPRHAQAYARVADKEDVVIIVRPVNPDATPLIDEGAATKVMDVKPKSSNWGPQKGYLPADQRYSKIWRLFEEPTRSEQIDKYNGKVAENLDPADPLVSTKHLNTKACNVRYWVYIDKNKIGSDNDDCAGDEIVLVPVQNPDLVCPWAPDPCHTDAAFSVETNIAETCIAKGPEHDLVPFEVIATLPTNPGDPNTSNFITADYDLLMIGFKEDNLEYSTPESVDFLEGVGQLTAQQKAIIDALNAEAGHSGGDLTHHGPENQFDHSPYVDYPLTVFAPDDNPNESAGQIVSIEMGDEGFRDINLKKYINAMRKKGYDLVDNPIAPGWMWTWDEGLNGFLLEDHDQLPDYVEQVLKEDCDKVGSVTEPICGKIPLPNDVSNEPQTSWLFGRTPGFSVVLRNTLVAEGAAWLLFNSEMPVSLDLYIQDAMGHVRTKKSLDITPGSSEVYISVNNLEPGIYTITVSNGAVLRFVRM